MADTTVYRDPDPSLVTMCQVTYALHALGLAIGAFGAATVVGSFLFGWPSIIAVVINYVKRGDARGTWLESHFAWQIRTAFSSKARYTGPRSPGELEMTRSTSAVAVCCCSDSRSSLSRRTFSIAMTA